jgi:hypothetical protein
MTAVPTANAGISARTCSVCDHSGNDPPDTPRPYSRALSRDTPRRRSAHLPPRADTRCPTRRRLARLLLLAAMREPITHDSESRSSSSTVGPAVSRPRSAAEQVEDERDDPDDAGQAARIPEPLGDDRAAE